MQDDIMLIKSMSINTPTTDCVLFTQQQFDSELSASATMNHGMSLGLFVYFYLALAFRKEFLFVDLIWNERNTPLTD